MTRPNLTLLALHLAGNALLLWLGYYWLGTSESRALTLLWSFAVALVAVCLACWLHGGTLVYFADPAAGLPRAFRTALRQLPAILAATLAVVVVYVLISRWEDASSQYGFKTASWLTLKLRKPVRPAAVMRIVSAAFFVVRWMILPWLLLPMVAGIARGGWGGFRRFARHGGRRLYWLKTPVLALCAFWLPLRLIGWVPHVDSFVLEILSFTVRLLCAYLLFVGSWLLLAFWTSAGKPVASQPKTTVSP